MSSAAVSLVEAYLGPEFSAASAFSSTVGQGAVKTSLPALQAFSPHLQQEAFAPRSARQTAPRRAPFTVAELAPHSARDLDVGSAVGSRTPSAVTHVTDKSHGHAWSSNHAMHSAMLGDPKRHRSRHRHGHDADVADHGSSYGEFESRASAGGHRNYLGSQFSEVTHATTPSWRSRSFPPAGDAGSNASSAAVAGLPSGVIQTAPKRRLPPLPDEARQLRPHGTPSEVRHLENISSDVHEANALLVESFLNVKRRLQFDDASRASESAESSFLTPSAAGTYGLEPRSSIRRSILNSPRVQNRREGLERIHESAFSDASSAFR